MGQAMPYLQGKLVGLALGAIAWTPPSTLYVIASTDPFTVSATAPTEPSGGSYARVVVPNNATSWGAPSGSNPTQVANLTEWDFAVATANWGTIASLFLADAATGGNLLYGTKVPGSGVPITSGSQLKIAVGSFVVNQD